MNKTTKKNRRVTISCIIVFALTGFFNYSEATQLLDFIFGISWSSGIATFIKNNTGEIVITLVATLWFEHVGLVESKIQDRAKREAMENLLDRSLESSPPHAMLHHCLNSLIGNHAANVVYGQLFPNLPSLENLDITLRASNSDPEGYLVELQISYECDSSQFLVGITDDPGYAETLMSMRFLNEIRVAPKGSLQTFTSSETLPISVDIIDKLENGSESIQRLIFHEIPALKLKKIIRKNHSLIDKSKFVVFEAKKKNLGASKSRYIIKGQQVNSRNEPYMFWMTDRLAYVRTINVDIDKLSNEEKRHTEIIFFMGSIEWASQIQKTDYKKTFPINTWLLNGQGIAVFWPSFQKND